MPDRDTHTPLADGTPLAEAAVDAFLAGLAAAQPDVIVKRAVREGHIDDWLFAGGAKREKPRMLNVLAIGKAAPRMAWGLVEAGVPFKGLGVAPKGVHAPNIDTFRWLPGDHPIPGAASFAAGAEVERWCDALPKGEPLLILLSGGSSACIETPTTGFTAEQVEAENRTLLRSGLSIEELNHRRERISGLKGGKLGKRILARTTDVRVWLMADTDPATAAETIGSAIFYQREDPRRVPHRLLASVNEPLVAAGLRLGAEGWAVYRHGPRLAGDLEAQVKQFAGALATLPMDQDVAFVAGGETDLKVAKDAPKGGRAQHAALALARELAQSGSSALVLCAATDGIDGETDAAGAWTTKADWTPAGADALARFDSHTYLEQRKRVLRTGPTGTNLNDLWIALRKAE